MGLGLGFGPDICAWGSLCVLTNNVRVACAFAGHRFPHIRSAAQPQFGDPSPVGRRCCPPPRRASAPSPARAAPARSGRTDAQRGSLGSGPTDAQRGSPCLALMSVLRLKSAYATGSKIMFSLSEGYSSGKVYLDWPVVGWGFVLFWVSFMRCPLVRTILSLLHPTTC